MNSSTPKRPMIPPPFVLRAVLGLRRALVDLADLLVPPEVALLERATGMVASMGLHVAARLGIADEIGDGSKTAEELARAAGVNADALHRVLRQLAGVGVFDIDAAGRFSNTRLSSTLRSKERSHSIRSFVTFLAGPTAIKAWTAFDRTMQTGKSSFDAAHGKTIWEHFAEHDGEGAMFAQGMTDLTQLSAPFVAAMYPFGDRRSVCDVAGGRGSLLAEILAHHPDLRGVLFDEAHVLERAAPLLEERGVIDRVERVTGNFFEKIPEGCDTYLLKDIVHDWDDERSKVLLCACRRAMQPGARLLIVELLLEEAETTPPRPALDVLMMVMTSGGRQRSVPQLRALLEQSGFRLERVIPTPAIDIVEAVAI